MLRKRITALALAAVMACTSAAPALAAGTSAPAAQALAEDNALVAIRIEATDNAVYGQPFEVRLCHPAAAREGAHFAGTDPPAGFHVGGPGQHPGL